MWIKIFSVIVNYNLSLIFFDSNHYWFIYWFFPFLSLICLLVIVPIIILQWRIKLLHYPMVLNQPFLKFFFSFISGLYSCGSVHIVEIFDSMCYCLNIIRVQCFRYFHQSEQISYITWKIFFMSSSCLFTIWFFCSNCWRC